MVSLAPPWPFSKLNKNSKNREDRTGDKKNRRTEDSRIWQDDEIARDTKMVQKGFTAVCPYGAGGFLCFEESHIGSSVDLTYFALRLIRVVQR